MYQLLELIFQQPVAAVVTLCSSYALFCLAPTSAHIFNNFSVSFFFLLCQHSSIPLLPWGTQQNLIFRGGWSGYRVGASRMHGIGVRLPTGGGLGVDRQSAPYWDTCLISIQDGWGGVDGWMGGRRNRWQYRRLIMPFEKRWRRKAVWKSEHLSHGMKALLRHCVKALGLSFEAYCICEHCKFTAKPKVLQEIHFLSSGNTFWWMRQLCC